MQASSPGEGATGLRIALLPSTPSNSSGGRPNGAAAVAPVLRSTHLRKPPLSAVSLFFLTYFQMTVLYGLEDAAASLSPLVCVLVFATAVPLLWVVPMCLITGELGTAFKDEGHAGATHWVRVAFGPFWGGIDGYLNVVASVADCSVQPALMFSYLTYSLDIGQVVQYLILFSAIAGAALLVYRGLAELGRTEEAIFVASALPFYVLIVVSLFNINLSQLLHTPSDPSPSEFFQVVFWSATYIQRQSVLASEVQDCPRGFPRALLAAGLMAAAVNAIGFFAICGADGWLPFDDWTTGTFKEMAQHIVGSWLGWWIVAGSVCSCVGSMVAGVNATVFSILGQAERGWLPRPLAKRGRHGTPAMAIAIVALAMAALQMLDYIDLVALDNFGYCTFSLLELAAFAKLRFSAPDLPRPFKAPFLRGKSGAALAVLPAVVIVAVMSCAGSVAWVLGSIAVAVGFVVVGFSWRLRRSKNGPDPDKAPPFRRPSWGNLLGGSFRRNGGGAVSAEEEENQNGSSSHNNRNSGLNSSESSTQGILLRNPSGNPLENAENRSTQLEQPFGSAGAAVGIPGRDGRPPRQVPKGGSSGGGAAEEL